MITTERQLRNILGLPPADNRRIIPVTPPTEARLEPDWDSSLAQMVTFQPDIVQQQISVRVAELQLLVARNQLLPQLNLNAALPAQRPGPAARQRRGGHDRGDDQGPRPGGRGPSSGRPACIANPGFYNNFRTWQVGFTFQMPLGMRSPLANTRNRPVHPAAAAGLSSSRSSTRRPTRWPGSSWKSTPTTSSSRRPPGCGPRPPSGSRPSGPTTRKAGSRSTGSSTPSASMPRPWRTEAQYKTTYNISIVALEEAKGTLLAYNNIAVAEGPQPRKAYVQARDIQDAHRKLPIPPRRPDVPPAESRARQSRPRAGQPAAGRPARRPSRRCRPRSARSARRPRPLPPYRPAGEPPILSQKPAQAVPGGRRSPGRGPPAGRRPRPTARRAANVGTRRPAGPPPSALPAEPRSPRRQPRPEPRRPRRAAPAAAATGPKPADELPVLPDGDRPAAAACPSDMAPASPGTAMRSHRPMLRREVSARCLTDLLTMPARSAQY